MKVKEWIKVLNKLDPEETICVHYWQVGDVLHMAEEMDEKVTNDEALSPPKRIWTMQISGVLLAMHHLLHSLKVNHYFLS